MQRGQPSRWQARQLDLLLLLSNDIDQQQRYLLMYSADGGLRKRAAKAMQEGGLQLGTMQLPEPVGAASPPADANATTEMLPSGLEANSNPQPTPTLSSELEAFTVGNYAASRKVLMPLLRSMPMAL